MWIEIPDIIETPLTEEEILLNEIYATSDVEEKHNMFTAKNGKTYIHFTIVSSKILNKKIKIKYEYDEITDLDTGECLGMAINNHIKEKNVKMRLIL